ncbi:DUF2752 domain-containing protein [Leptothoe kymatousa]|uniref:DUF2752 domain-containing protein n=1 Tax=Leptothoe kymatousa TAU-MAC 1615 TaxID=2364775 RepID=A0ABS5Y0B0_9CYAN|nr:DUF2752 domain-containing protein [Leptothoe kymatousa]MBT9311270.1 DUF2752 domain-containing protein [Leptothoe kymatousa TAU-MAC 1615]
MPLLIVVLHRLGYEVHLWGCFMQALVGIPCPTWGMTRAVFEIANAQWSAAIQYNLLAPFAIVLWGVALVHISAELWTRTVLSLWWRRRSVWLVVGLMVVGYHGHRLYDLWTSGTLAVTVQQSWLYGLLG